MKLKQSDTINKYDKEMKSQEEIKHFQESAALFYKDARGSVGSVLWNRNNLVIFGKKCRNGIRCRDSSTGD